MLKTILNPPNLPKSEQCFNIFNIKFCLITVTEEAPHWPKKEPEPEVTVPVHISKDNPIPDQDIHDDYDKRFCEY